MFDDMFKKKYKEIPFAIFERSRASVYSGKMITTVLHNHRELEILTIRSGKAIFLINEKKYPAKTGDIVFVPPYHPHHIQFFDNGQFADSCICFDLKMLGDEQLQNALESGHMSVSPVVSGEEARLLERYIDEAIRAFQRQTNGWKLEVIGNMMLLFGKLDAGGNLSESLRFDRKNDFCCKVIYYIEKHFQEPITSKDAATALFLHHSYFCRIFKKHFQQTFGSYLCFYRMEKSRTQLLTTGKNISEIAAEVGFNSESYYIQIFRQVYGSTPGEYRRCYQKEKPREDFLLWPLP